MFTHGFKKTAAAPGVASMASKAKGLLPNFMKAKAPVAAVASKVKGNVAASAAARGASKIGDKGFTSGFSGSANMHDKIKTMPNAQQGRIEKSYAKSKGVKVEDRGSQFEKAQRKAKAPASAPSAPAAKPADGGSFMSKIKPAHAAIGAGGAAAGYLAASSGNNNQQQR
jgi:hypothetical protein